MPDLVFFCELESDALKRLFSNPNLIDSLKSIPASISLGLIDLSNERAEIVKRINQAGIPVTAWLLLPREEGYWFNLKNTSQATAQYEKFLAWTLEHTLKWDAIGLDIEPDINMIDQIALNPLRGILQLVRNIFDGSEHHKARIAYATLINQMHRDGFLVESYQIPLIADDRKARSHIIQRALGILELPVDREVFMLYSSLLPNYGAGFVNAYAQEARAIALGSTGGGVAIERKGELSAINWKELNRDLLIAAQFSNRVYIFSLEGCILQDMLLKIQKINWNEKISQPLDQIKMVKFFRLVTQSFISMISHPLWILLGFLGLRLFFKIIKRK